MKRKSKTCSRGHGGGVSPVADLRTILERDRYRAKRKQALRLNKKLARERRRGAK